MSAQALLESAKRENDANPEAAYALLRRRAQGIDGAARQQGLRTKSAGHHVTIEQVVRAQFGGPFDGFGLLRRRRSEIEYPRRPGDTIEAAEAAAAVSAAGLIIAAAQQLQPQLDLYR